MGEVDLEGPASSEDGLFGLGTSVEEAALVLVPAPFDATASYRRGAARGPAAILAASPQLDFHDPQPGIDSPFPRTAGVAMLSADPEIHRLNQRATALVDEVRDAGYEEVEASLREVNTVGAALNDRLREAVTELLDRDRRVGLVGGDHATALGAILAQRERHPRLGVLQIDAHADLRQAYEGFVWSHASVMHNLLAAVPDLELVQVGLRDLCASEHQRIIDDPRVRAWFAPELAARRFAGETYAALVDEIINALPRDVYVSLDVDGLDPTFCPHTGTPVPGGLSFDEACFLLRRVVTSGRRVVGFDLVEVAPGPAGDEYDGNVGARLLFLLCRLCLAAQ